MQACRHMRSHTPPRVCTHEFRAHTAIPCAHTHTAPFLCPRSVPRNPCFSVFVPTSPLPTGTHVHHTWQLPNSLSLGFPYPGSGPHGLGPGPSRLLLRPRLAARGGGSYDAVPGSSTYKCLSSQPLRSWPQTLITASAWSLAWVGVGPGNPAGGARRRGRRRRCESPAAPPRLPGDAGEARGGEPSQGTKAG